MLNAPLVSVIIPCYNQGQYLDETLQSVYNQSYTNWECLIINDGSLDNSLSVAQKWADKDSRFIVYDRENKGRSRSRNIGLENAGGEWIQFLDSDDSLHEDKFKKSINIINDETGMILTDFVTFKESINNSIESFCDLGSVKSFDLKTLILEWEVSFSIPIHCGFFRKKNIDLLRFNEKLHANEDWSFWVEYYKNKFETVFLKDKMAFYRVHSNGTTSNHQHMNTYTQLAKLYIFSVLPEGYKILFVERLLNEIQLEKLKHIKYKDKLFFRKLFYTVKNLFFKLK